MKNLITFTLPGGTSLDPVEGMADPGANANHVVNVLTKSIVTDLFVIATIAALFFLIWGGISWASSGGEKEKLEKARKKIIYAIIGLCIVFLSFFIINTVGEVLGVKFFKAPW